MEGWPDDMAMIVPAPTRASAQVSAQQSAASAGWSISFIAFKVTRAAEYDYWANTARARGYVAPGEDVVRQELGLPERLGEARCPWCGAERADYEGTGLHLPACPNCGSERDPERVRAGEQT
jgi:hypothetical protein